LRWTLSSKLARINSFNILFLLTITTFYKMRGDPLKSVLNHFPKLSVEVSIPFARSKIINIIK